MEGVTKGDEGPLPKPDEGLPRVPPPPYTAKAEDPIPNPPYPIHPPPPVGFVAAGDGIPPAHVAQTVTVVQAVQLDRNSQIVVCGQCGARGMTNVKAKPNSMTHTIALILCCFVCWPCAWLPYACDDCQSIHHYCSNCDAYLGEYRG